MLDHQHPVFSRPIREDEVVFKNLNGRSIEQLAKKLRKKILKGELSFQKTSQLWPTYEIWFNNCWFQVKGSSTGGVLYYFNIKGPCEEDHIEAWGRCNFYITPNRNLFVRDLFYAFRNGREQEERDDEDAAEYEMLARMQGEFDEFHERQFDGVHSDEERERVTAKQASDYALGEPLILMARRRLAPRFASVV